MGLSEIQHAIETLPAEQQLALLDWLAERDRREWDSQIERDFSPDGAGIDLLNQVKARIHRGESAPMGSGQSHR
jgi:hypothetical protein